MDVAVRKGLQSSAIGDRHADRLTDFNQNMLLAGCWTAMVVHLFTANS